MIVGVSIRYDCDREECKQTGITALPDGDTVQTVIRQAEVVRDLLWLDGWCLTPRGLFCLAHKPRDWNPPASVKPVPSKPEFAI